MSAHSSLLERAQALYEGELYFVPWEEGVSFISRRFPSANVLVLLDSTFEKFFPFFKAQMPSATLVVIGKEGAEKLFSLFDDFSLVLSCGENALAYARYFCTVRSLPSAHFCLSLFGNNLFSRRVRLFSCGMQTEYPVRFPEYVFIDGKRIGEESRTQAYIGVCTAAVELSEEKFISTLFPSRYTKEEREGITQAYTAISFEPFLSIEGDDLFAAAYVVKKQNERSAFKSEVSFLSEVYKGKGCGVLSRLYAAKKLALLYDTFFQRGIYRRYYTPPYHRRAKIAAFLYGESEEEISSRLSLPSVERLGVCADTFERERGKFILESKELLRRLQWIEENIPEKFSKRADNRLLNAALRFLPEGRREYGVTSLMRDFGLMEF